MIDWSKPLELMDGTPVRLDPDERAPDEFGGHWVCREDGKLITCPGGMEWCSLSIEPNGEFEGKAFVRNRAEPTPETLTLRDQFAMAALTGIMATDSDGEHAEEWVAKRAYHLADAMLTARKGD